MKKYWYRSGDPNDHRLYDINGVPQQKAREALDANRTELEFLTSAYEAADEASFGDLCILLAGRIDTLRSRIYWTERGLSKE